MTPKREQKTQPADGLRADAVASRAAIVAAATEVYRARGIDVPVEEIAKAAGVGRSTLYRHFPTRESLFAAMLDEVMTQFEQLAAAHPDTPDALLELFDAVLDLHRGHPAVLAQIARPALPDAASAERRRRFLEAFRQPLATAQAAGVVRDDLRLDDLRILIVMLASTERRDFAESDRARARELIHRSMLR